jgi:hypothetical protein
MLEGAHISLFPADFDIENPMTPLPEKDAHRQLTSTGPKSAMKDQLQYDQVATSDRGLGGSAQDSERARLEHLLSQQRLVNSFRVLEQPNT